MPRGRDVSAGVGERWAREWARSGEKGHIVDEISSRVPPEGRALPVRRYEPLVPAAVAIILGVLAGEFFAGGMLLWSVAALAAAGVWAILYFRGASARWTIIPLLVLMAAGGAARYRASVDPPPDDVARLAADGRRLVTLEGVVVRSPRQSSPPQDVFLPSVPYYIRTTMRLRVRRVRVGERWLAARGCVQATVRAAMPADGPASGAPVLGDGVQVTGILAPLAPPANPGTFDVAAYLRRQGVRAALRTDHWEAVRVVEPAADSLRWAVGAIGRWALARFDRLPSKEGRAIVAAMLLGRRDLLDFDSGQIQGRDIERAFLATGTVHYMAVSGFNVAMVAAPFLILARWLGRGPRLTAVTVALAVLAFALATELEPPVLRAAILFWVLCLAWWTGREALGLNTLAAAVILILLVRPGDLFTTSFQLSFLAVLGMIFFVKRLDRLVARRAAPDGLLGSTRHDRGFWWRRVLRGSLIISVAATIMTVPLIASRFHIVAWLAPVASALLFPLVFAMTVGGMALAAFGGIAPWLQELLAAVPDGLGRTILVLVQALARVPGAYFYVGEISAGWLLAIYGLLAAWVWRRRLGIARRRLAMAALAAAAVFLWTTGHRPPEALRATFLAVGNGNTNLLELPNGRTMLYDAGSSLSHARAAEATIAPALWARGVERLDAVFISHPHFDHFKDILPLVDRFGVREVFVPPTFLRSRLRSDNAVVEALLARGVRVTYFAPGDRLVGTGAVEVRALWPRGPASQTRVINNGSLVLAVTGPGAPGLLLTGDIEPAAIAGLLAAEPDLRADVLLWPHHGHAPEAVGELVKHTGARVLVVSSGRPYLAPPDPGWLKRRGIACRRTGECGAVTVTLAPDRIRVETFLSGEAGSGDGGGGGERSADIADEPSDDIDTEEVAETALKD